MTKKRWIHRGEQCKLHSSDPVRIQKIDSHTYRVEGPNDASLLHYHKNGEFYDVHWKGRHYRLVHQSPRFGKAAKASHDQALIAPLTGTVKELNVKAGDKVEAGQKLVVLEAMKMEYGLEAPRAGIIGAIHFNIGDVPAAGTILIEFEAEDQGK